MRGINKLEGIKKFKSPLFPAICLKNVFCSISFLSFFYGWRKGKTNSLFVVLKKQEKCRGRGDLMLFMSWEDMSIYSVNVSHKEYLFVSTCSLGCYFLRAGSLGGLSEDLRRIIIPSCLNLCDIRLLRDLKSEGVATK
jgi:hypothetical protein